MWCWSKKVEKSIKRIENLEIEFCIMFFQGKTWKRKDIYSVNHCQNK